MRGEDGRELFFQELGIGGADAHRDLGADVANDRIADVLFELCDELVCDGEREAVLARFGEDGGYGGCCEILKFVDIQIERRQFPARVDTRECGLQEFGDEHEPEKLRIAIAKAAFGEIGEKNLLLVHDLAEIERRFFLCDDGPHDVVRQEDIKFARDVRHDILQRCLAASRLRNLAPELHNDRILAAVQFHVAELAVGEDTRDLEEGRAGIRILDHEHRRVAVILLEHRAERLGDVAIELAEYVVHRVYHEGLHLGARAVIFEHVEAHRAGGVGRIEIDDIARALGRDESEHVFDVVAVWINESDALAALDVLPDHIFYE